MALDRKRVGALALRLSVGLVLLGCPRVGSAQGNWSLIADGNGSACGQVYDPRGLAVDGVGNLYVADTGNNRVLKYTPAP